MNYINLIYGNNIKVDGVELPKEILLSLETRGKRSINHRFNTLNQEIEVRCSICKNWISLYKLENNLWKDVNNGAYWISTKQNTNLNYYSSSCFNCYQDNKKKKNSPKSLGNGTKDVNLVKSEGQEVECGALSSKNDRIQQTIALSKENDRYIKLNCAVNAIKKNDFLNMLLNHYRQNNPIHFE